MTRLPVIGLVVGVGGLVIGSAMVLAGFQGPDEVRTETVTVAPTSCQRALDVAEQTIRGPLTAEAHDSARLAQLVNDALNADTARAESRLAHRLYLLNGRSARRAEQIVRLSEAYSVAATACRSHAGTPQ